jgi:hypothetical protein
MFIINLLRFFLINKKFYILFQEGIITKLKLSLYTNQLLIIYLLFWNTPILFVKIRQ